MALRDNRRAPAQVPPLWAWLVVLVLIGLALGVLGVLVLAGVEITALLASVALASPGRGVI